MLLSTSIIYIDAFIDRMQILEKVTEMKDLREENLNETRKGEFIRNVSVLIPSESQHALT